MKTSIAILISVIVTASVDIAGTYFAIIVENPIKNPLEKGFDSQNFSSFLSEKVNILRSEEGLDC